MSTILIQTLYEALEANDPQLIHLVIQLSAQREASHKASREGVYHFKDFLAEIKSYSFSKKSPEEKKQFFQQQMTVFERGETEAQIPERLKLYDILLTLWARNDGFSRYCLLSIIPKLHLSYGPWKGIKQIFKEAEAQQDYEMYGAIAARLDRALAAGDYENVSSLTMLYLCRRAWRTFRQLGETFPVLYVDAVSDCLAHYDDTTNWQNTWVFNHIFYHETQKYSREKFRGVYFPASRQMIKHRAFADLWLRTPRPLFSLLERTQAEIIREYACSLLKTEFRASLRDIEPQWVVRLMTAKSQTIDAFVVWVLESVPKFEKDRFKSMGLHQPVMSLLLSEAPEARTYAVQYGKVHGRDVSVDDIYPLLRSSDQSVSQFALDLLQARHPKKDITLDQWCLLLGIRASYKLASNVLREHYTRKELDKEWFKTALSSKENALFEFGKTYFLEFHRLKEIGSSFFCDLIEVFDGACYYEHSELFQYCLTQIKTLGVESIPPEFWMRSLTNPNVKETILAWLDDDIIKCEWLDVEKIKVLAYRPAWEASPWIRALKQDQAWATDLEFDGYVAYQLFDLLGDVRRFSPEQIGFQWLMALLQTNEPLYHDFAFKVLNKSFLPADFAVELEVDDPSMSSPMQPPVQSPIQPPMQSPVPSSEILKDKTFLFTGKLSQMTRAEAQLTVTEFGGQNVSGVNKKLNYLVIGDEGSPLYGEGKKGSKQIKAEKIVSDSELKGDKLDLHIISETAFLKMLKGDAVSHSDSRVMEGCEHLWSMLTATQNDSSSSQTALVRFAKAYILNHHQEDYYHRTDRHVDPGAEIPKSFLRFEKVEPLLHTTDKSLRDFAVNIAKWEFARWQPEIYAIIRLAESPHQDIRQFIFQAFTAPDEAENRYFRLDHQVMSLDAVYSLCESKDEMTRKLGMHLIDENQRLQEPSLLFRLTESPDRHIRAFVIHKFWHWYRQKGIALTWQSKTSEDETANTRSTPELPADMSLFSAFLRRALFEIPPGRSQKEKTPTDGEIQFKLKALPTRKAKLNLVETLRDIAIQDKGFAQEIMPLLEEFKHSKGQSEYAACLVALTRLKSAHPTLALVN